MMKHECEWELNQEWGQFVDAPPEFDGYVLKCACGAKEDIAEDEINRRLNEYEKLKRATEALSAVDANWCAGVLMEATNNHGVEQKFNRNPYYLADVLKAYADTLEGK